MKKKRLLVLSVLACIIVAFGLQGCGKKVSDKFPADYKIASVKVGGMTAKQAKKALNKALDNYKISVKLDDVAFDLKSNDLDLKLDENVNFKSLIDDANSDGKSTAKQKVFTLKTADELQDMLISSYITAKNEAKADDDSESVDIHKVAPYKAVIQYDSDSEQFVGVDGVSGEAPTYSDAAKKLAKSVQKLDSKAVVKSIKENMTGEKASDIEEVKKAIDDANSYLEMSITCDFKPDTGKEKKKDIVKEDIAKWLIVGNDGRTIELDSETIATFCSELATKYDVSKTKNGKFKTSGGDVIDIQVPTAGQTVDANKLYEDVVEALKGRKNTTVNAVYVKAEDTETGEYFTFGGNYCEVDLTNQMVYVYKDGKQVVSSKCVTGNVSKGYTTPAGVYSIFSIDKDRYLNGAGYKTWVNFFVPFNGGIGFHDASWRSVFGGNIYLYSGSHGCINMPYDAAKTLYENVSMGEKVILYGGETHIEAKDQTWSGETQFTVNQGADAFNLGVSCLDNAKLTYESDNESVASVDEYGNVTPVSAGTANITINSEATGAYKASSVIVTVTVNAVQQAPQQTAPQAPQQTTPQVPQQTTQQPQMKNPKVTIACGDKTVTEGDESFNVNASVDSGAALTYESSDSSVASVDASGNITIFKAGTVTVTVKASATTGWNEGSSKVIITVNPKPQEENNSDITNAN